MLIRLCAACAVLAVVLSSSAHAKTINQTSGLTDTAMVEVVEGTLALAQQCSNELASIFGNLKVCTPADELHFTAFIDLLESVDQAQADYWVQSLVELGSELPQPQQAHIFQEDLLLALIDMEITIEIGKCSITICINM